MTNQRDPDRRPGDFMRRDDGSWSTLPILLVVALILGGGYMIYSANWNAGTTEPIAKRSEAPVGERPTGPMTMPPATSTPPATTPPMPEPKQ